MSIMEWKLKRVLKIPMIKGGVFWLLYTFSRASLRLNTGYHYRTVWIGRFIQWVYVNDYRRDIRDSVTGRVESFFLRHLFQIAPANYPASRPIVTGTLSVGKSNLHPYFTVGSTAEVVDEFVNVLWHYSEETCVLKKSVWEYGWDQAEESFTYMNEPAVS